MKTQKVSKAEIVKAQHNAPPKQSAMSLYRESNSAMTMGFQAISKAIESAKKPETLALIKHYLDSDVRKVAEDMSKLIRDRLMEITAKLKEEAPGVRAFVGSVGDNRIQVKRQEIRFVKPDLLQLGNLLALKKLDPKTVTKQVITYEVDEEKVAKLIAEGKLTKAEVDSCRLVKQTNLTVEKL